MALTKSPAEILEKTTNPLLGSRKYKRKELKSVAEVTNGFAFNSSNFNSNGRGMPIIRIRDVGEDQTDTYYEGDYEDKYIVKVGDLLIGMDGDFRIDFWRDVQALLNQRVCRIDVDDDKYNQKFLYYFLQPFLDEINKWTSSVTVKHLSSRTIEQIPLIDISLPEQQLITQKLDSLFSKIDAGEEGLRKVQQQLEVYRQAVLKKAFEDIEENIILEDLVIDSRNGLSKRFGEEGIETVVLRLANISAGKISDRDFRQIKMTNDELKRYDLRLGDILFLRVNGSLNLVGRAVVFEMESENFSFCDHFIRTRLKDNILPSYLKYFFESETGRNEIKKIVRTTAGQNTINQQGLLSRKIPFVGIEKQLVIVEEIKKAESIIEYLKTLVLKSKTMSIDLRQSILKKAFNGDLI